MKLKRIVITTICVAMLATTLGFSTPKKKTNGSQSANLNKQIESLLAQNKALKDQVTKLKKQVAESLDVRYVIDEIETQNVSKPGAILYNGTLFAPIEFMANKLGSKMTWDNKSKTVIVGKTSKIVKPLKEISLYTRPYLTTNAQRYLKIDNDEHMLKFYGLDVMEDANNERNSEGLFCSDYYIEYPLSGKATKLLGSVFVDDNESHNCAKVYVYDENGKELYKSDSLAGGIEKINLDVDVKNVMKVKIVVKAFTPYSDNYTMAFENLSVLTTDYKNE